MSVVVARRQPSVPAWAWMSAALALLLLITVMLWAYFEPSGLRQVNSKPVVEVKKVTPPYQPASKSLPDQDQAPNIREHVDWSQSTKDFEPPAEAKDANPKVENVKRIQVVVPVPDSMKADAPKQAAAVQEADQQDMVPPAPRIQPEVTSPDSFDYGGTKWKRSDNGAVSADEAELSAVDGTIDGHGIYALTGENPEPSVLFVETSPGSGHYSIYRPG